MLRQQRTLDRELDLERVDPRLVDVLRLGAYQLRHLSRVPAHAAVSTSVELARQTVGDNVTGYVNRALRRLSRVGGTDRRPGETHPAWLIAKWQTQFGADDVETLVAWNDRRPAVIVQPVRWTLERLEQALVEAGLSAQRAPFDAGLEVAGAKPQTLPGFREGAFVVQDPAHALLCRFAAIPTGQLVYDGCAAPGGKAVSLEAAGARVIAGDIRHDRLGRLVDTTRRAGVAIRSIAANLEAAPLRPGSLDAVFVDAPCSATGTMRRHPDARWRLAPAVFARAAARQTRLLAAAATLVRSGGLLIYATCSLEPEENQRVVDDFLSRHPEFGRSASAPSVPAQLLTSQGDFQSLPQRHGIDGAYAARLVRAA